MRYAFFLLLFAACAVARPQSTPGIESFFIDPVGKEYFLLSDGALSTGNPLGQNQFAFFDSSLGSPDGVDVTNPFAVLLFYADYGEVVIVDRTLSEVSRLDLYNIEGIEQPTLLARSTDNGIWIFDSWDYRLKLLDQRGDISSISNDLRLSAQLKSEPAGLFVYQNLIFIYLSEENQLGVFTNYGRFERWIKLPEGEDVGWLDGRLTARDSTTRWTYDVRTDKVARTQVQGALGERWLPVSGGYQWLNPKTNKVEFKENK